METKRSRNPTKLFFRESLKKLWFGFISKPLGLIICPDMSGGFKNIDLILTNSGRVDSLRSTLRVEFSIDGDHSEFVLSVRLQSLDDQSIVVQFGIGAGPRTLALLPETSRKKRLKTDQNPITKSKNSPILSVEMRSGLALQIRLPVELNICQSIV
jgi:hypothetical protein